MGLLTTLTLTWGLALWYPSLSTTSYSWQDSKYNDPPARTIFVERFDFGSLRRLSTPDPKGDWFFAQRPIQSWSEIERQPTKDNELIIEDARGWPFLAMRTTFEGLTAKPGEGAPHLNWYDISMHAGIRIRPNYTGLRSFEALYASRALPLRPILLGLVGNLIFWSSIWALLPYVPFLPVILKKRRRLKRNQCVNCAYDLRGLSHEQCPECGVQLKNSQVPWRGFRTWVKPTLAKLAFGFTLYLPISVAWSWTQPWPIFEAIALGDKESVQQALDDGVNLEIELRGQIPMTPLFLAIHYEEFEVVRLLLEHGADSYSETMGSALAAAASRADLDLLEALLSHGADLNRISKDGNQTFASIVWSGVDVPTVEALLAHGADLAPSDSCGITPLTAAIMGLGDSNEVAHFLIAQGAPVDEGGFASYLPLIAAIQRRNLDLIEALLDHGANLDGRGSRGQTPFLAASRVGDTELLQKLIQRGADINAIDKNGRNAVMYALRNPDDRMIPYLVSKGIDINATDDEGMTVLMHSVRTPITQISTLERLIELGARVDLTNTAGLTAADYSILPMVKEFLEQTADQQRLDDPSER